MVDSQMGDLSYSSSQYWSIVKMAAERCYREWLQSSPLERLRLKPTVDDRVLLWPRTERRALAMLLQSAPEHLRGECVTTRKLSTDQVLFRLLVAFQPGGAHERTKLLQTITDGRCGETVGEVVEWVRGWRRHVGRAIELGVSIPDALVLVGALQQASDFLSQRNSQVAYRLNLVRQQLGLDYQPCTAATLSFAEHLQAEAEEMQLSTSVSLGLQGAAAPKPRATVKSLQGAQPGVLDAKNAQQPHVGASDGKGFQKRESPSQQSPRKPLANFGTPKRDVEKQTNVSLHTPCWTPRKTGVSLVLVWAIPSGNVLMLGVTSLQRRWLRLPLKKKRARIPTRETLARERVQRK